MKRAALAYAGVLDTWSTIPTPSEIVWSKCEEAIKTEQALTGKLFEEIDIDSAPMGTLGGIAWFNLTAEAAGYYFGSYLLVALSYAQTLGRIYPGIDAMNQFQSMLEGARTGHPSKTLPQIYADQFDGQVWTAAVKAVAVICDCSPKYFYFVNFDPDSVLKTWAQ